MATRKTTLRNRTTATPRRKRAATPRTRKNREGDNFVNFFVPLFLIVCMLGCIGFLAVMGYRTATASDFFSVRKVEIEGREFASKSDIEKIVNAATEKSGVWNADLRQIRERVEKLDYVKTAAVSRVLPDGLRVNVVERQPRAVVRLSKGDFWVGDDGLIIAPVGRNDRMTPFVITGWDEDGREESIKANAARLKIYAKMVDEWRTFDLDKRVREVNLKEISKPIATVEDSGETVEIWLPKDNFGKKLQTGIESIAGKGLKWAAIDVREVQAEPIWRKKD
jgi:cell division septal protein FtsQ